MMYHDDFRRAGGHTWSHRFGTAWGCYERGRTRCGCCPYRCPCTCSTRGCGCSPNPSAGWRPRRCPRCPNRGCRFRRPQGTGCPLICRCRYNWDILGPLTGRPDFDHCGCETANRAALQCCKCAESCNVEAAFSLEKEKRVAKAGASAVPAEDSLLRQASCRTWEKGPERLMTRIASSHFVWQQFTEYRLLQ